MMIKGFTAVGRWRRVILPAALVIAVIMGVLSGSEERGVWVPVFRTYIGASLILLLLMVVSTVRYRPAVLIARPDHQAFAAPPNPTPVLFAAAFLLQGSLFLGDLVTDIARGEAFWVFDVPAVGLWGLAMALIWRTAWGRFGVELQPEGLSDRQPLGSLFVPWDALVREFPAAADGANRVALYYGRPDAVRRKGLRAGGPTLPAAGIDAAFLAGAVAEYVRHPEHRGAIGTEAELHRLTAAIS